MAFWKNLIVLVSQFRSYVERTSWLIEPDHFSGCCEVDAWQMGIVPSVALYISRRHCCLLPAEAHDRRERSFILSHKTHGTADMFASQQDFFLARLSTLDFAESPYTASIVCTPRDDLEEKKRVVWLLSLFRTAGCCSLLAENFSNRGKTVCPFLLLACVCVSVLSRFSLFGSRSFYTTTSRAKCYLLWLTSSTKRRLQVGLIAANVGSQHER